MRKGKGLGGSSRYSRSWGGEGRDGSSFTRRCLSCCTVEVSTCLRRSNTSCQVENITSPDNFILLNNLLAQSKEKSMQQRLAACAAGDPAWDPLPPHAVPKEGTSWYPSEAGGGVLCRSSSSVGAVLKKGAWDSGELGTLLSSAGPKAVVKQGGWKELRENKAGGKECNRGRGVCSLFW